MWVVVKRWYVLDDCHGAIERTDSLLSSPLFSGIHRVEGSNMLDIRSSANFLRLLQEKKF